MPPAKIRPVRLAIRETAPGKILRSPPAKNYFSHQINITPKPSGLTAPTPFYPEIEMYNDTNSARRRAHQLDLLLQEAEAAVPFLSTFGQPVVTIPRSAGYQVLTLHSAAFRSWLTGQYDRSSAGRPPSPALVGRVIYLLESRAVCNPGDCRPVFHCLASRAIDITPGHWTLTTSEPPALFLHHRGSQALPEPAPSTGIPSQLRALLNPATDLDYHRILRALTDPSTAPLAQLPTTERQLLQHARENCVLAFDQLTDPGPRLATGAGFRVREARENRAPIQSTLQNPIIITAPDGSTPPAEFPDLTLTVRLAPITPETRRTEARLWRDFANLRPAILGALCTAVSHALLRQNEPENDAMTQNLPRCADAFVWAAATGLLSDHDLRAVFSPDPRPFTEFIELFMETRAEWTGTAAELLDELPVTAAANSRALSVNLRHSLPELTSLGIHTTFTRTARSRQITLRRNDTGPVPFPALSVPSVPSSLGGEVSPELPCGTIKKEIPALSIRRYLRLAAHIQLLPVLESGEETLIGGQAVMEGVMMRAPHSYCVAVRKANGEVATEEKSLARLSERYPIFKYPILRGLGTLGQAMSLGVKALRFSANALLDEGDPNVKPLEISPTMMAVNLVFSLAFFIFMYKFVPLYLATALGKWQPVFHGRLITNLVDGVLRITLLLGFLFLLSRMKDIRRMFEYHGAEHKVVFNFESGKPVTVQNAQSFTTYHPRCGTSFLIVLMFIAALVYAFLPFDTFAAKFAARIVLLPLIVGLSYEMIRFAARRQGSFLAALTTPGLWLQRVTTKPPSDDQTAVAIQALNGAMDLEKSQGGELVIA